MYIDEKILVEDIRKAVQESGDSDLLREVFFDPQPPDKRTDREKKSNNEGKQIAFRMAHFLLETLPDLYRFVEELWKNTPDAIRRGVMATAEREFPVIFPDWYREIKAKEELFVQMINEIIYRWGFRGTKEMRKVIVEAERLIHPEDHDILLSDLLKELGGENAEERKEVSSAENRITQDQIEKHEYHFQKGEVLFTQGKFEEAIEEYKRAIALEPNFAKLYLYIGDCYFSMGVKGDYRQFHFALPYFEKAVDLDSKNSQAWRFLSDAYYQLFNWELAYDALKVALSLDPELRDLSEKLKQDWLEKLKILELRVANRKDLKLQEVIEEELRHNSKVKEVVQEGREELGFQDPEIKERVNQIRKQLGLVNLEQKLKGRGPDFPS